MLYTDDDQGVFACVVGNINPIEAFVSLNVIGELLYLRKCVRITAYRGTCYKYNWPPYSYA